MSDLGNKTVFAKNLKYYLDLYNKERNQICKDLNIRYSTFSEWINGNKYPRIDKIELLANYFGIMKSNLIENHDRTQSKENAQENVIRVPVLGYVAAGIPIEAIEEIIDYEELNATQYNPNCKYFGLKIKGDSMMPRMQNGDVVIVRQQPDIESGEIGIVCVNGDNATCKQIKKHTDGISLISFNASYDVKFYTNKEIEEMPITILGKVVELRAKF